jgi:hypothetical protein
MWIILEFGGKPQNLEYFIVLLIELYKITCIFGVYLQNEKLKENVAKRRYYW